MPIRLATLEDTHTIGTLFRRHIERWQRMTPDGQVDDLPYDKLTIYERWLHGGAWMSDETAVLWLSHLLRGAGLPYVAVDEDNAVIGYLECFVGDEPAPIGKHLHIGQLLAPHSDDTIDELVQFALQEANRYGRIHVNLSAYDQEAIALYTRYGMAPLQQVQRLVLSTQTGQGFYKTTDHPNADATQIKNWGLFVGRLNNARQQWETLWTALWDAVPPIAQEKIHRLKCSASGQEAFLCFKQHLYDPRTADLYCWSPKPFSAQLLIAVRDWAHRNHYRNLVLWGDAHVIKIVGTDAETTPQQHLVLAREV
jgi:hypothetical protein